MSKNSMSFLFVLSATSKFARWTVCSRDLQVFSFIILHSVLKSLYLILSKCPIFWHLNTLFYKPKCLFPAVTEQLPCTWRDQELLHGEEVVEDECMTCWCDNSSMTCNIQSCEPTLCNNPVKHPSSCCSYCRKWLADADFVFNLSITFVKALFNPLNTTSLLTQLLIGWYHEMLACSAIYEKFLKLQHHKLAFFLQPLLLVQ